MTVATPFEPIAEVFERNLSVRHVYAEPVRHGDTTIIPVAKVAYGFGAGGGRRPAGRSAEIEGRSADASGAAAQGGGGGGGARLTPVGALEIGPHGTRFIRYDELPRLAAALAIGIVSGVLLAARWR